MDGNKCNKTDAEHDWELLGLSIPSGAANKFAVQIMAAYQPCTSAALERGFESGYFYLMDVTIMPCDNNSGYLCRVLKLTPKGIKYRDALKLQFAKPANTAPA